MAKTEVMDRGTSSMEEAFDVSRAPVPMPAGPQQVIIENRPNGAQKVAVMRQKGVVLRELKALASAAGDGFFYRWPVESTDKRTGQKRIDYVEGPSVKCTNAVAREYGNCFVQCSAVDQGTHWMISARFVDLETGYALERPFQQRKSQNIGGNMDKDRALDIVFQIGISKATRNVVANALSEFVDYAFEEAKQAIVGKIGKNMNFYREKCSQRLQELDVPVDRVERLIGKTIDKWLAPDLARVVAEIQSVNDGMADPEDMWPLEDAGQARPQETTDAVVDPKPEAAKVEAPKEEPKKAETKPAAKPKDEPKPKEEPKTDGTEAPAANEPAPGSTEDLINSYIRQAAEGNQALLDKLDEAASAVLRQESVAEIAEAQNKRWNHAYMTRRNEFRAGHTGASALLEMLPAAALSGDKQQAFQDWLKDQYATLAKVATREDLDVLEDKVAAELEGDAEALSTWKGECAKRYRAMFR